MPTANRPFRILVSDKLSPSGVEWLSAQDNVEVVYTPGLSSEELQEAVKDVDGLIIRSASKVTRTVLESTTRLKVVGRAGIGVDNVDIPAASERGVLVMNEPAGNNITTAEHAISLLLSLTRHIPHACASMKAGKWEKSKFMGTEITGSTFGIIGLGNIGKFVAERALGLKMRVIAHDPFVSEDAASELGVELREFDDLLAEADFLTIHTPLLPQTRNMLDGEAFSKMKDGVLLVNAARGGIVDEDALLKALDAGKVAGAAVDVFAKEPTPADHPVVAHPRVIATPHLGASTRQAQERVALTMCAQMVNFLKTGTIQNAVNLPRVNSEAQATLQNYTVLAERMGKLLGSLADQAGEIKIELRGKAFQHGEGFVTNALLCGLVGQNSDLSVNLINAAATAKEMGWSTDTHVGPAGEHFASEVNAVVHIDGSTYTATGAVFGDEPRLVELNGARVEARLEGPIFVMLNSDQPGVIGAVGTTLAEAKINVNGVHLAIGPGEKAISIWSVNNLLTGTLDALTALDHVEEVRFVDLG